MHRFVHRGCGILLVLWCLSLGAFPAAFVMSSPTNTFVVNHSGDASDRVIDGICEASRSGECTLRAALQEANARFGLDIIHFNIPTSPTIRPLITLPLITSPVVIDGRSQGGWVELDGSQIPSNYSQSGLNLSKGSAGSTIRGLVLNRFQTDAMSIGSPNAIIQGNRIGTDVSGTLARPNGVGISVHDSALIGGITVDTSNLISGNWYDGIRVSAPVAGTVSIEGNRIGTNASGTVALPNMVGIQVGYAHSNVVIGGSVPGVGNLISGNSIFGIYLLDQAVGVTIQQNLIGTDVTATKTIPNYRGIDGQNATRSLIGGSMQSMGNVIAGNTESGIRLSDWFSSETATVIQGNWIGTNRSGTHALPNRVGIELLGGRKHLIGGISADLGNIISGNISAGIILTHTLSTSIYGNAIGATFSDKLTLGNGSAGIILSDTTTQAQIGNGTPGGANRIYGNSVGIAVRGNLSVRNQIAGNQISDNTQLGIDLGNSGVAANDPTDSDTGPNGLQNHPVLGTPLYAGSETMVTGTLTSTPNLTSTIELYGSATCDDSGYGEGEELLARLPVMLDATGTARFTATLTDIPFETVLTATATDQHGNTSEFSKCALASGSSSLRIADALVNETDSPTMAVFTVTLSTPVSDTVTVEYYSSDGSAKAPTDYIPVSGTLLFNPGQTMRQILVPINTDLLDEADETMVVQLANSTQVPIFREEGTGTIADDDAAPSLTISDQIITESLTETSSLTLTVEANVASAQKMQVAYGSYDGSASNPADYMPTQGVLTFEPGQLTQTITVTVYPDTINEGDETFTIELFNPHNATLTHTIATITIIHQPWRTSVFIPMLQR